MNANFEFGPRAAAFYPGLVTAKFYKTWDFYTEQLGFHTIEESEDSVRLAHPSGAQLAILRHETDRQPVIPRQNRDCARVEIVAPVSRPAVPRASSPAGIAQHIFCASYTRCVLLLADDYG